MRKLLASTLLLVLLAGCGNSRGVSVDSRSADRTPALDGQADHSPLPDGQPDSRRADGTLPDASPPDATVPDAVGTGGYLLWQAPGGFAGTGPALEILADGTAHLWKTTSTLQPHNTTGWSASDQLSPAEVATLFGLLAQVDYSKLPHPGGPWAECYPSLHYEPCGSCPPHALSYSNATSLEPEMSPVYTWLAGRLSSHKITLPAEYCIVYY